MPQPRLHREGYNGAGNHLVHHLLPLEWALALERLGDYANGHMAAVGVAICWDDFKLNRVQLCSTCVVSASDTQKSGERARQVPCRIFRSIVATTVSPLGEEEEVDIRR